MSLNKKDLRMNFVKSIFECLHLWMWAFVLYRKKAAFVDMNAAFLR